MNEKTTLFKVFAVVGLLVGVGGISTGAISWINTTITQERIKDLEDKIYTENQWYTRSISAFFVDPVYIVHDDLNTSFYVEENESVYFSYMAICCLHPNPNGDSNAYAKLLLDGSDTGIFGATHVTDGVDLWEYRMICFQFYIVDLTSGVHLASIAVRGKPESTFIHKSSLFIQAIPTS
ncbi:MAG: hypothetical protein ACFE91_12895 [Promethearchaeota archaeon]